MPESRIETDKPADTGTLVTGTVAAADEPGAMATRESVVADLLPIALVLAIAAIYFVKYYFAHHTRQELQNAVRAALARSEPLTPDLLDHLGQAPPRRTDFRRGVIFVGFGIGLGAFGLVVGEPDAVRPILAVGLVALLLGLAPGPAAGVAARPSRRPVGRVVLAAPGPVRAGGRAVAAARVVAPAQA